MRSFAAVAAFVAAANAYAYNTTIPAPEPVYTTKVVTELTTVCPGPTEIPIGGTTYTVTESTTLTITNCPCTIVEPVEPTPAPPVETPIYTPAPPVETPVVPSSAPPPAPYPSANGTVPQPPAGPTGTAAPTTPAPPAFTGAATQAGVGLLAVAGALAAFL